MKKSHQDRLSVNVEGLVTFFVHIMCICLRNFVVGSVGI